MIRHWLRDAALCFSAGAAGGLAKGLVVWGGKQYAVTSTLAAYLAIGLHPEGIYARVVWSGLYALLFLLPLARGGLVFSGLLWAAIATLLQSVVLPLLMHNAPHLAWEPLLSAFVLNIVWSLTAALLLRLMR